MTNDKPTLKERILSFDFPRGVQAFVAAIVGLSSGLSLMASKARIEFHDKMNENKDAILESAHLDRANTLDGLRLQRLNGQISESAYVKSSHEAKALYNRAEKAYESRLLGVHKHNPIGAAQRAIKQFRFMGDDTQRELIFSAGTAVGVGVVGTLIFFNNLSMHNKLNKLADQSKTPD